MVKTYNKLVRDLIPEIIEKSGNKCVIATLDEENYQKMLDEKLLEEVKEYQTDKTVEELCDVLEVVYAIAQLKGVRKEDLEKMRLKKRNERGGFEKRILLKSVIEKD